MNISLFLDKVRLALLKRSKLTGNKKNRKTWLAKGYCNAPQVTVVIQTHNKSLQVEHVVEKIRQYKGVELIVMDDGSDKKHTRRLTRLLTGANEFLLRANDLYENIMYDRALRMANGKYVALLQDDDDFEGTGWMEHAVKCFAQHEKLVILGGKDGIDLSFSDKGELQEELLKDGNADFEYVMTVNRAPMWINRELYLNHLHHIDYDFAPFQYDDYELCLRAWKVGLQVGWYEAGFYSLSAGGMRIWNNAFSIEQCERNTRLLIERYKDEMAAIKEMVKQAKQ